MKIIHIASFAGNSGDIINHEGFYKGFRKHVDCDAIFDSIEIRKFYKNCNEMKFDIDFVNLINTYDLMILGGGGFFDVRWNDSDTGTTLDFSDIFIDSIRIPVIINGMGFHESYDNDYHSAYEKFEKFINKIKRKDNWYISVRNDGSMKRLECCYGSAFLENIYQVPDNGFFFTQNSSLNKNISCSSRKLIGLNITNDLFFLNFTNDIDNTTFNKDISVFLQDLIKDNYDVVLFAHAPQDIDVIYQILNSIDNESLRSRFTIAPYRPFDLLGVLELEKYYAMCDVIVAMRFHANILALQNKIPTIALAGHEQISSFFEEIQLSDYCVKIGENNYIEKIALKIQQLVVNKKEWTYRVNTLISELETDRNHYMRSIKELTP